MSNSVVVSIKQQLITKISACEAVHKVYGFENLEPDGFPVVFITPVRMDGEFISTAENRRVYQYRAMVAVNIGQSLKGMTENAMDSVEETISQVLDQIINSVDKDYDLSDYNAQVLFVQAADVEYGYVDFESGYARTGTVMLAVETDFNVTEA